MKPLQTEQIDTTQVSPPTSRADSAAPTLRWRWDRAPLRHQNGPKRPVNTGVSRDRHPTGEVAPAPGWEPRRSRHEVTQGRLKRHDCPSSSPPRRGCPEQPREGADGAARSLEEQIERQHAEQLQRVEEFLTARTAAVLDRGGQPELAAQLRGLPELRGQRGLLGAQNVADQVARALGGTS